MAVPDVKERWTSAVTTVTIGATKEEGGTRDKSITVGGAATIPFMKFEGDTGNRPVIAMDVLDAEPKDWSPGPRPRWSNSERTWFA